MKNHLKINQFSSNKAIYSQVILNNKVISSNKESLFNVLNTSTKILVKDEIFLKKTLSLYNDNKIKFNTLKYILLSFKTKDLNITSIRKHTNQINIEYSIEGGLY